jgi:hypothetical protein
VPASFNLFFPLVFNPAAHLFLLFSKNPNLASARRSVLWVVVPWTVTRLLAHHCIFFPTYFSLKLLFFPLFRASPAWFPAEKWEVAHTLFVPSLPFPMVLVDVLLQDFFSSLPVVGAYVLDLSDDSLQPSVLCTIEEREFFCMASDKHAPLSATFEVLTNATQFPYSCFSRFFSFVIRNCSGVFLSCRKNSLEFE